MVHWLNKYDRKWRNWKFVSWVLDEIWQNIKQAIADLLKKKETHENWSRVLGNGRIKFRYGTITQIEQGNTDIVNSLVLIHPV